LGTLILALLLPALPAAAQIAGSVAAPREPGPIQDNSFLVEEAYNQEPGVVQHIQQFQWSPATGAWSYTFTQEWPVTGVKHQLSYTIPANRVTGEGRAATGLGDILLNYRYQLVGDSEAPVAMAPRLSVLLPTGSAARQLGAGGAGAQISAPVSVVSGRFQANGNAGATWIPAAKNEHGQRAGTLGYNFGASLIWRGSSTLDLMLEAVWARTETPSAPGHVQANRVCLISPGLRWAYNFATGLQIVPGVGIPIGVGPSHDHSVLLYLSFEHPFVKTDR
jgi:hypothetical protein